jgi:L,D-peptidoglycan transpeptidase YkuD (ErfK/YbiS/YcfS/YnhG family)
LNLAVVALCMVVACGRSEPAASLTSSRPPTATTTTTTTAAHDDDGGAPHAADGDVIPDETRQLVTAITPSWDATTAELRLWERARAGEPWTLVAGPWPGVIGKTGAGWGMGRHGRGPPPGHDGPLKREGDGRSPAGAFLLQASYGYADHPPAATGMPYQQTDAHWQCVDDPRSDRYTQIVDRRAVAVDWTSAEDMRRPDALYTWVVDVGHNPTRIPNGGSCIFLHVWSGPGSTTVGCTAMEEPRLATLLGALSLPKVPVFVLLPRDTYAAVATGWQLPPLSPGRAAAGAP